MDNKEIRSYEISLWTLQDEFITVLKWSDARQKRQVQEGKVILDVDGTGQCTFSIPMYLDQQEFINDKSVMKKYENPLWHTFKDGFLIEGMRKIKLIFNKATPIEKVFEFLIIKVSEEHSEDQLYCRVECESLPFHELGKIGYKISLSQDKFELDNANWAEKGYWVRPDGREDTSAPIENLQYWCEQCYLQPLPDDSTLIDPNTWYYKISMLQQITNNNAILLQSNNIIYEAPYTSSWDDNLTPLTVETAREKQRPINIEQSNIYNITQTIAETFRVHCRYEYLYDDNYHIIGRIVIFYNNYSKDDDIISFTYPYNTKEITREIDSSNITTKMYVSTASNDALFDQEVSIINSKANDMQEDYLLDFDYMYKVGAINVDQYLEIESYKKKMHTYNDELASLSATLQALNEDKIAADANLTIINNSLVIDNEQCDNNSALYNALDSSDGDEDGYFTRTNVHPYSTYIKVDKTTGQNYITLSESDKGLSLTDLHIYNKYDSAKQILDSADEILTSYTVVKDDYGFPVSLYFSSSITGGPTNIVYLTYKYAPRLYYEEVLKIWKTKLYNDTQEQEVLQARVDELKENIETTTENYNNKLLEKQEAIRAFERMMGPALREGYWQPDDYTDYGNKKHAEIDLSSTYNANILINDTEENLAVGWDNILFDTEDKLYYEEGVLLEHKYYPCIDLSGALFTNISNLIRQNKQVSFIFNNNYFKDLSNDELDNIENITVFTIGGDAKIIFAKQQNNVIKPLLLLTGAKGMNDADIQFMLNPQKGHPRLGVVTTTLENDAVKTTIANKTMINTNLIYWNKEGYQDITTLEPVFARIKCSSLEFNQYSITIKYSGQLLENYSDYSIINRLTRRNDKMYPEFFITIKPETLLRIGTFSGQFIVDYVISNAATAIYLDAKEIMKENSIPKLSYSIAVNILDKKYMATLYNNLAQIIQFNDFQLKLQDAFGYISHIELDLDFPWNDTVEVKNYTTKFEDLFSTIVAQTEEMKRREGILASMTDGGLPLGEDNLNTTLTNNAATIQAFLDSHFDNSQVVKDKLTSLFSEAGKILAEANTSLNQVHTLTLENAAILGGFVENIQSSLTPQVYTSKTQPENFKFGDIWNQVDDDGNIIGRYVATSSSSDTSTGFTRTFDGILASIKGANLNIDAVNGKIEVLAENQIDMKSGGNIYIAANERVDIVGNDSVNIGGTQINIGSTQVGNSVIMGGINLVAAAYNEVENEVSSALSKVLISPYKIEMGSAEILMKAESDISFISSTGTTTGTSVVDISAEKGVYIGSGKGLRLFSGSSGNEVYVGPSHGFLFKKGDYWIKTTSVGGHPFYDEFYRGGVATGRLEELSFEIQATYIAQNDWDYYYKNLDEAKQHAFDMTGWTTYTGSSVVTLAKSGGANGASVELNNEHLILGFANTQRGSASAIEMNEDYIIIATGDRLYGNTNWDSNLNVTGKTTNNGLVGAKFTKESIGFATSTNGIINAFIMNNNGLTLGSQNTNGAIDIANADSTTLRSHFNSTSNGSYVRVAPTGIEIGSLGDLYINTDNFKLQTHSRSSSDYPNGEYIDGNTILALGAGFNQNNITGRESITDLRTLAERETNPIDIKLVVNQDGAYFKGNVYANNGIFNGTVYASAGSFTGTVIANSFTLNDNNAYSIATTYALSTSTSQPENSSFTYTSKPTTSQISTYANGLTASQKEQIYLWSKTTTSLGGKSTSIYSCEHVNEDGTTDIIKIDYAVNSTASVPSNATWYTDIATAKNQISQSNQFLITRTKIFQNYTWSTSYDFAKLLDDPESPQVYVESIKMLYYLSTGSAPSQITGTTEVTSTVDSTDTWTLVVPSYTGTSTSLYTYYTCEQKKWVNHTPTLEWTAPVQNYGLTIANQHATAASAAAAKASSDAEPIVTYGLDKNITWNGDTYALALGNNKSDPMLIGSNGGVTIVDTNIAEGTAGYGSAIVLKGGGIGMHGSTINFTTADATTTNAISINSSGITMGTTGNITLLSNNIILNSTATGTDSLFELKKKASDWTEQNNKYDTAMKYSITNGLEIKGAITATSLQIITNGTSSTIDDYVNGKISSAQLSVTDERIWQGVTNYANGGANTGGLLITAGQVKLSANNNYVDINTNGIVMQGQHIYINGKQEWSRDDIIILKRPGAEGYEDQGTIENRMNANGKHDWVLIKPYYDAELDFRWSGSSVISGDNTFILTSDSPTPYFGNTTNYHYTLTISYYNPGWRHTQILAYAQKGNTRIDLPITPEALNISGNGGPIYNTDGQKVAELYTSQNIYTLTYTSDKSNIFLAPLAAYTANINLCQEGYIIYVYISDTSGGGYSNRLEIRDIKLHCTCDAVTGKVPCTVYYYP